MKKQDIKLKVLYGSGLLDENSFIVTNNANCESVIIDPDLVNVNIDALLSEFSIKAILLTHCHFDHVYSAEAIKQKTDAPVYINELDKAGLEDENINLSSMLRKAFSFSPDVTFTDSEVLKIVGLEFMAITTPGHTKGSSCFMINEFMFSGDTLFSGSAGRTDFPGGSFSDMLSSFKKLSLIEDDYTVYPGHGESTSLSYEKKHNPYFNMIR